jgi:hypothetical protein
VNVSRIATAGRGPDGADETDGCGTADLAFREWPAPAKAVKEGDAPTGGEGVGEGLAASGGSGAVRLRGTLVGGDGDGDGDGRLDVVKGGLEVDVDVGVDDEDPAVCVGTNLEDVNVVDLVVVVNAEHFAFVDGRKGAKGVLEDGSVVADLQKGRRPGPQPDESPLW